MAGGVLVLAVVSQQDSEPVRLLQLIVQRPQEANLPAETVHSKGGGPARDGVLNSVMWVIHVCAHHRAQQGVGPRVLTNSECA